jgi:hypothetical protein
MTTSVTLYVQYFFAIFASSVLHYSQNSTPSHWADNNLSLTKMKVHVQVHHHKTTSLTSDEWFIFSLKYRAISTLLMSKYHHYVVFIDHNIVSPYILVSYMILVACLRIKDTIFLPP